MVERKYYIVKKPFAQKRVVYRRTLFSGKIKETVIDNDFDVYFYEENGAFYEFFSGRCLGTYEDVKLSTLLHKNIHYHGYIGERGSTDGDVVFAAEIRVPGTDYLKISFYHYDDGIESRAETSAAEFAQKVKPLLAQKDYIAKHFQAFLNDAQRKKSEKEDLNKVKREEAKKEEQRSEAFLEQFIKGRS